MPAQDPARNDRGDASLVPSLAHVAIGDWLRAFRDPFTYSIRRNIFTLIGFFWGLPVPLFALGLHIYAIGLPLGARVAVELFARHPIHWFFALHPLFFALAFGAMGTVRKHKIERIAVLVENLRESDRQKHDLVANITHELRTPLVAVEGYIDMALESRLGPVTEQQVRGLGIAARNARRLRRMVEQLLDLWKLESGAFPIQRRPVNLIDLATDVLDALRPEAEEKRLKVTAELPPAPVVVNVDPEGITQVLSNLLRNAFAATPPEGAVSLQAHATASGVRVEVRDTGPGIPEGMKGRVFTRYARGNGRYAGAGLGLAIVRAVLEAHGTEPDVESTAEQGTTFRFFLPAVEEPPHEPTDRARRG